MSLQKGVADFISETLTPMTPLASFQGKLSLPLWGWEGVAGRQEAQRCSVSIWNQITAHHQGHVCPDALIPQKPGLVYFYATCLQQSKSFSKEGALPPTPCSNQKP